MKPQRDAVGRQHNPARSDRPAVAAKMNLAFVRVWPMIVAFFSFPR